MNKVPKGLYSLNGGLPNETYCIEKENGRWQVFLKSICGDMLKDEAMIQLFFDGEEIEMDIFKKC